MELPRRNVELKASDPDPADTLAAALALGAVDHGVIEQRDTYFQVAHGALKLREQLAPPAAAQLIQYERADEPQQRESRYLIAPVADAPGLLAVLDAALGIRGTVEKRRRLLLWRDVRIHLDAVERLGAFVELEAVARVGGTDHDLAHEHALVAELRDVLSITDDRLVAQGYAALLGL